MRNELENTLKNATRELALREREKEGLTQEIMAEALYMSTRSYSDIECGITSCGALTVVLLLLRLQEPELFLQELKREFAKLEAKAEARK